MINVQSYGAVGDGITDDTAALQAAINAAYVQKTGVYAPGADYLTDTLIMPFPAGSTFCNGTYIDGDGMDNTRFIAKNSNTIVFDYIQPAVLNFQRGGHIAGCTIVGGAKAINSQAQYNFRLDDVIIDGAAIGWNIVNQGNPGDYDACNHIILNNSRILNCASWGIKNDLRSGNNETSFISIRDSTIESCGTAVGAVGGGMYWRGQMLQFDNSAFVTCQNRGLYIEGGAGLGSNLTAHNLTFENNVGIHLQCYGITGMNFHNLQMYSNDTFKTTSGFYLNAQSYIGNVRVHSAKIRATSGNNPNTMFNAFGANLGTNTLIIDSSQVRWDLYGSTGQTKYSSGWVI